MKPRHDFNQILKILRIIIVNTLQILIINEIWCINLNKKTVNFSLLGCILTNIFIILQSILQKLYAEQFSDHHSVQIFIVYPDISFNVLSANKDHRVNQKSISKKKLIRKDSYKIKS